MLNQWGTVYTPAAIGGAFTVVARADLPCRLSLVGARGAASGSERAELLARRQLYWDASYALPAYCQVELSGERWTPVVGTEQAPTHPATGEVLYRAIDVVRAEV